jgi:hypothetical protein
MGMKGLKPLVAPLQIKNAGTQPKFRDDNAPVGNQATSKKTVPEKPIHNSVQKKQFGNG